MGGASSEWVEKGAVKSKWAEWQTGSGGWVGGVRDKVVKKAESAGELVTKAESADEER